MTTISTMLTRVRSINLRDEVPQIIEETSSEIIQLNHAQLFERGEDKNNADLKPYSFLTENYKRQKNQPFDRTTLKDTGAFYRGFFVNVNNTLFAVNSKDRKTKDLTKKYGEDIFGLTKQSKTKYALQTVYGRIKKHITQKTGLAFK